MPKVSVIVPVYGVEKYIGRCIESVLAQTYTDFELILVDDGSPDGSGAICDEYSQKDNRVKVFHKENGGVSSARNLGLEKSCGEWITFIDADDRIESATLSDCCKYMRDSDLIRFSMVLEDDNGKHTFIKIDDEPKEKYLESVISRCTILGICGGIYKKELFSLFGIRFDERLTSGEDWLVLAKIVAKAQRIKILQTPFYIYNKANENSCTYSFKFKNHLSAITALQMITDALSSDIIKYKDAVSKAKCDLVYDYVASKIAHDVKLEMEDVRIYRKKANLTCTDVIKGTCSIKKLILLFIYWSWFGRLLRY